MTATKNRIITTDGNLKWKLMVFSMLTILFLLAAFGVHYFYGTTSENINTKKDRTQEVITEKENLIREVVGNILEGNRDSLVFSGIHSSIRDNLWEDHGIILFIYENDSLLYWSGNHVPALPYSLASDTGRGFFRHGNGWFKAERIREGQYLASGLILIKQDYPYQNDYLKNEFSKDFYLPTQVSLDTVPGKLNIQDKNGDFLFSLEFPEIKEHQDRVDLIVFFVLAASLIFFLILLFYLYHLFDFFRKRPWLLFMAYLADVAIIRLLLLVFKSPGFLYETDLFSPYYYATSFISPSLGDLVLNNLVWLLLAWLFYYKTDLPWVSTVNKRYKAPVQLVALILNAWLFYLLIGTMRKMIVDSSFDLTLNNVFGIDLYSLMGFFAIAAQFLAFFLISAKLSCLVCKNESGTWKYILVCIIASGFSAVFFLVPAGDSINWVYPILFFVYLLSFLYFARKMNGYRNISGILFYIVLFSVIGTFVLDYYQEQKEKEKRKILAAELSSKRDPMMEFEYKNTYSRMTSDTSLLQMIEKWAGGTDNEAGVKEYLRRIYFKEIWDNYEQLITICVSDEILEIQPTGYLVNCFDYFQQVLASNEADTVAQGLFFFNNRSENNNYIAVLEFGDEAENQPSVRIFIELYYKYIKETGLGYPDLLIDKRVKMISGLSNYSYSRYFRESLVYKYGDFSYHLSLKPYYFTGGNSYFIDNEGYSHFVTRVDEDNVLIISKKNPGVLDLIAPFSYLFILFSVFLLVFILLIVFPGKFSHLEFNFSNQLQLSIILIIVTSFFILGVITRSRIIHLNNDKNRNILSEKTFSVLTELEHKIGNEQEITPETREYLKDLLYKFSTIFYSDINLYDPTGNLISSSRPQIFEEGLLSEKMNTEAFLKLAYDHNLLYIQNEKIGKQEYLSAYIPFRNNDDRIIAYLNLPYFAKQTEIRKELSDFLVAYINVYVLLIVVAIVVTIIVSRLVTRPLLLIREKLGGIGLGKANEKIEWNRQDEIGNLVEEYNRMVDELARSAELLASSERESAWREMAKQVAHEIKNPLTPMKLSVQYLKKAWDEKAPDWESRLDRFSATIIEQIDSLSQIASEFSDFAKMPVATLEKIELTGIIRDAVNLFKDIDNIHFEEEHGDRAYHVEADKRQLLRVFNNLIQNAVQAIGEKPDGLIRIQIVREGSFHVISITDNGTGISEDQAARMFTPSFTTKSSGMGLGLAMVKNIVTSIGGTVSFISEEGNGATFILKIPEYKSVKS